MTDTAVEDKMDTPIAASDDFVDKTYYDSGDENSPEGFFGSGEAAQIEAPSNEDEVDISTEILIMLSLLMLAVTLGHYLKKSKHQYL